MTIETPTVRRDFINARYQATAVRFDQYPEGELTEIAFIGRSNVGKSSLINSLCRHSGLARVSGTPGKTQTLNFYQVTAKLGPEERQDFRLVDLPGYGYARTGRDKRRCWSGFTEEYWLKSTRLALVCLLIDSRHPPQPSDIDVFSWLRAHDLPVQLIATKADKIARSKVRQHLDLIRRDMGAADTPLLAYSATDGSGRQELLDVICDILLK
ncbi:MAG TPA: ribosome biogenesis GTP-binding protein YihA/YsxC [Patescibacteria group bacterium]|nr:ribosome biogenesis GTP-binding protein YihA/YsxC [Patescibacteria group bacterium]